MAHKVYIHAFPVKQDTEISVNSGLPKSIYLIGHRVCDSLGSRGINNNFNIVEFLLLGCSDSYVWVVSANNILHEITKFIQEWCHSLVVLLQIP